MTLMTFTQYSFTLKAILLDYGNMEMEWNVALGFSYVTERLYERIKAIVLILATETMQHCFHLFPHALKKTKCK